MYFWCHRFDQKTNENIVNIENKEDNFPISLLAVMTKTPTIPVTVKLILLLRKKCFNVKTIQIRYL